MTPSTATEQIPSLAIADAIALVRRAHGEPCIVTSATFASREALALRQAAVRAALPELDHSDPPRDCWEIAVYQAAGDVLVWDRVTGRADRCGHLYRVTMDGAVARVV